VFPVPANDPQPRGATVWLTGLPSAGKSTIASALAEHLRQHGRRVEVLDGDEVRTHLSAGLGFSRADRDTNILRIGFVADLLARNGVVAVSAAISPFAETRAEVRRLHEKSGTDFLEVYVATSLQECSRRDVKGLYAKQASGQISGLTGVDDPYEPPESPELAVQTVGRTVADCVADIVAELDGRGLA
jgi:adenylylsulfate kinase